jgi:large subunit ribosomal protein L22
MALPARMAPLRRAASLAASPRISLASLGMGITRTMSASAEAAEAASGDAPLRPRRFARGAAKNVGPWLGPTRASEVVLPDPSEPWERTQTHELPPFIPGGWDKMKRGKQRVVRQKVLNLKAESSLVPTDGAEKKREVITKLDKGAKFRPRMADECWARSHPDRPWRVSQKKCNHVLEMIRGVNYPDALSILRLSDKRITWSLIKLLEEARVRAEDRHGFDPNLLYVKETWVTRGPILYRMLPHSKGRAGRVRKPTSHITIILGEAESPNDHRLIRRSSVYQPF